ncbi:MAG: mechanosensitive ion channel family protein [Leptospiraceae bacterium]|nr:mechanosensitive ion channel family protein [Leptospiraceae bacterium]MCP5495721.1 mechanosensitive ion channel family protein [Leptospiraceae bacterium]
MEPVKIDSPREALQVFLQSMNRYKKGIKQKDEKLSSEIDLAIRCLNMEDIPYLIRKDKGREAAIFLKEVIDRVYVPNYSEVPLKMGSESNSKWVIPRTEITISRVEVGDRTGEYLISKDTVFRAKEFYQKVKHLPYKKGSGKGAGYSEPWTTKYIPSWAKQIYFFVVLWKWLGIILAIFSGYLIKVLSKYILKLVLYLIQKKRIESKIELYQNIYDSCYNPIGYLSVIGFWFLCLNLFPVSGKFFQITLVILELLLSIIVIWFFYKLIDFFTNYIASKTNVDDDKIDLQLLPFIRKTLKVVVVILGFLVVVQNLGVNVVSIMAGLGIGGLVFAFAAKDTAANLFGSIMILLDKPFKVGDYIVVGNTDGKVEEIGFRTTRIRTLYNSLVSIPNAEVANVKIDNMEERQYRRTVTKIGIGYDTLPEKIEGFMEGIKNILKANQYIRKDYINVSFNGFGEYSLEIFILFHLIVPDYLFELSEKNNLYLEILRLATDMDVTIAYPTRSIHIEATPEKSKPTKRTKVNERSISQLAKEFGVEGKKSKPYGSGIFTHPVKEKEENMP